MWLSVLLTIAQAEDRASVFSCVPERNPVVYGGVGVLTSQGPLDIYLGIDGDVAMTMPVARFPCLQVGLRQHVTAMTPWIEEGASGYEYISKTHGMIGSYGRLTKHVNAGGFLLGGVKAHHVRQTVSYPERDLDAMYTGTAFRPSFYLYTTMDYFPFRSIGFSVNASVPLMDIDREMYWYSNRIIGVGIVWRR